MDVIRTLPVWLRWVLLLPASITGGFIVGYLMYLMNSSEAAKPDAPIVIIAEFLGGLVSNFVAFYIAYEFAPSHKRQVLIALISIGVLAGFASVYISLVEKEFRSLFLLSGNLLACYVGWKKLT